MMQAELNLSDIWAAAIGLQTLEQGTPSFFLREAARQCSEGNFGIDTVSRLVEQFYERYPERAGTHIHEADRVTIQAARLLSEDSFVLSPAQLISIDRRLFEGAEEVKEETVSEAELEMPVVYAGKYERDDALAFLFESERRFDYSLLDQKDDTADDSGAAAGREEDDEAAAERDNPQLGRAISHIAGFISDLWQVHMFDGSNTQTIALFTVRYLKTLGFEIRYQVLADHTEYFKYALIRACYMNLPEKIYKDSRYLVLLLRSLVLGEEYALEEGKLPEVSWDDILGCPLRDRYLQRKRIPNGYDRFSGDQPGADSTDTGRIGEKGTAWAGGVINKDIKPGENDTEYELPGRTDQPDHGEETVVLEKARAERAKEVVRRSKSYRREQEIMELLAEKPSLTLQELAEQMSCSESTVKRALQRLKSANSLERTGARKNGQWKIREKEGFVQNNDEMMSAENEEEE